MNSCGNDDLTNPLIPSAGFSLEGEGEESSVPQWLSFLSAEVSSEAPSWRQLISEKSRSLSTGSRSEVSSKTLGSRSLPWPKQDVLGYRTTGPSGTSSSLKAISANEKSSVDSLENARGGLKGKLLLF